MRIRRAWAWTSIAVLAISVAGVVALHEYKRRYPSWLEEVRLSDGRVVEVRQRRQVFREYGANQSWVTMDLPELGGRRTWRSHVSPQGVNVLDGQVYVFGGPLGLRHFKHYRMPKHYLVAFRWNGAEFERIPFLAVPEVLRQEENIYPCMYEGGHLSLAQKALRWCPERGDRWKFGKLIDLQKYTELADFYASLSRLATKTD